MNRSCKPRRQAQAAFCDTYVQACHEAWQLAAITSTTAPDVDSFPEASGVSDGPRAKKSRSASLSQLSSPAVSKLICRAQGVKSQRLDFARTIMPSIVCMLPPPNKPSLRMPVPVMRDSCFAVCCCCCSRSSRSLVSPLACACKLHSHLQVHTRHGSCFY